MNSKEPASQGIEASLVRLDRVEAWSPRAFRYQGLLGTARPGAICLLCDGTVIYTEQRGLAPTRWRMVHWRGRVEDLGQAVPAPRVLLERSKYERVQRAQRQRLLVTIGRKRRVLCFTGLPAGTDLPKVLVAGTKVLAAGKVVVENVPLVGSVAQLADTGITQARLARHRDDAVAAAAIWRSLMEGTVSPGALPLFSEAQSQQRHERHRHRAREI